MTADGPDRPSPGRPPVGGAGTTRRRERTLAFAAATGAVVGVLVAGFERLTRSALFLRLLEAPLWVQAGAPLVGLVLAALLLRTVGRGAGTATSDEYIRVFHLPDQRMPSTPVLGKMLAGVATLGFGGALGLEGPSLYVGAATGSAIQHRWSRWFSRDEVKVLMVAGAAAGVAAIFKAPATGAVFALEVPYRDDTAKGMLLPALLAAGVSYLVYVTLIGTEPLFVVAGTPAFDLRDLGGAVLLGAACGFGARGFAMLMQLSKAIADRTHPAVRAVVGGVALGALAVLSAQLYDGRTLAIGSGYRIIDWIGRPEATLGLVLVLLLIRTLATSATLAGGGVGGLFVPLVVAGALVGKAAALVTGDTATTLFPLIGVAAFLGAGYRTPLAGVMFVAETTGRAGFIVPALLASVASQLPMGSWSCSPYQRAGRADRLERHVTLPLARVVRTDVPTAPAATTLAELFESLLLTRADTVPVLDGSRYLGMVSVLDLHGTPRDAWATTTVADAARRDWPVATTGWTIRQGLDAMEAADVDELPVVDDDDRFVGVASTAEVLRLGAILGEGDQPGGR